MSRSPSIVSCRRAVHHNYCPQKQSHAQETGVPDLTWFKYCKLGGAGGSALWERGAFFQASSPPSTSSTRFFFSLAALLICAGQTPAVTHSTVLRRQALAAVLSVSPKRLPVSSMVRRLVRPLAVGQQALLRYSAPSCRCGRGRGSIRKSSTGLQAKTRSLRQGTRFQASCWRLP